MHRPLLKAVCEASRLGCRCALRSLLLAAALIAYGSLPSTALVQTEVESELQEEATPASSAVAEMRRGLVGSALRHSFKTGAVTSSATRSPALAARYIDATPHLSAGLALPLRC